MVATTSRFSDVPPLTGVQPRVEVGPAKKLSPEEKAEQIRRKVEAISLGKKVIAVRYEDHHLIFDFEDGMALSLFAGELHEV